MKGIDIYNGTGTVDFSAVKKAGYDFVMIKSSEGHTLVDKSLTRNLTEAAKAGLHTGVYHWFWGRSAEETQQEIDFFLKTVKGCQMEMPVALDVEQADLLKLGRDKLTQYIKQWCDGVKAGGYYPIIYANKAWLSSYIDMSKLLNYDIWIAQYNSKITYTGAGNIGMWQYTSTGKVPGVGGGNQNADVNVCYRDYPSIIRIGGFNNHTKEQVKADVSWDTKEKTLKMCIRDSRDGARRLKGGGTCGTAAFPGRQTVYCVGEVLTCCRNRQAYSRRNGRRSRCPPKRRIMRGNILPA